MDILASVIIPAYNAEETIRNAVRSALEQSLVELERFTSGRNR